MDEVLLKLSVGLLAATAAVDMTLLYVISSS